MQYAQLCFVNISCIFELYRFEVQTVACYDQVELVLISLNIVSLYFQGFAQHRHIESQNTAFPYIVDIFIKQFKHTVSCVASTVQRSESLDIIEWTQQLLTIFYVCSWKTNYVMISGSRTIVLLRTNAIS
ncbi:Hypothetical_protein [Hexamita inflata]|uniref:Hypothetical_protein n=1 Tax=Hexamita inflata TaxID=28002 RepID=A0AA86TQW2_9EUKA|nr:Hypothetical protein HINF_LOCUS12658 [Hexamita inflata]CAI9925015.1 Hypothetical protein HINF_LOCUS12660 [Hexamita inflata]